MPIGGLFSVALSCGSPRLAVSQHPALWSPDLPRPGRRPELPGPRLTATTWPAQSSKPSLLLGHGAQGPAEREAQACSENRAPALGRGQPTLGRGQPAGRGPALCRERRSHARRPLKCHSPGVEWTTCQKRRPPLSSTRPSPPGSRTVSQRARPKRRRRLGRSSRVAPTSS